MERGYSNCKVFIEQFHRGELQLAPGCTAEETLEVRERKRAGAEMAQESPPLGVR